MQNPGERHVIFFYRRAWKTESSSILKQTQREHIVEKFNKNIVIYGVEADFKSISTGIEYWAESANISTSLETLRRAVSVEWFFLKLDWKESDV